MVATPIKVLLFLIGGAGAAGATAYVAGVLDPWIYGEEAVAVGIAETAPDEAAPKGERLGSGEPTPPGETPPPALAAETPPAAAGETPPADAPKEQEIAALTPPAAGEAPPAAVDPAQEEPEAVDSSIPRFDVVRVEPDGSIVIAGKAPPLSYVEVLTPAEVIATDSATPQGDFAAVPDERLKPGDYEIRLRAIAPGNVVTVSEETALVSIPDTPDGQVLALVEKPGEPSRIITLPSVPEPKEEQVAVAPEPEKPAEIAAEPEPVKPGDAAAAAEPATPAEPEAAAPAGTGPEEPAVEQEIAAAEPSPEAGEPDVAPPAADAVEAATPPADGTPPPAAGGTEIAAVEPEPEEPAKPEPQVPVVKVTVEAVEIDGPKVFVAGAADPGLPIRVYANEMMLGENRASAEGRYLVEAERDLPVGDYIIRADALAPDGTVIARAAVPFEREPGEAIAAVAPPVPEPRPADPAKEPEAAAAPEAAESGESGIAAAPEPAAPEKQPEAAGAAEPSAPAKEPETAGASDGADAAEEPEVAVAPEPAAPEKQPEVAAAPEPASPEKVPEVAAAPEQAEAPAPEPVVPEKAPEIAGTPPAEITAPKLEPSASGVIIRRGDTLWRISKRVYGRGIRYSTIYLANQDQIQDPDRIWPGQVFKVPEKTDQGEAADMTAVGEQATSVQ